MFYGSMTALVCPMHANGDIDFATLERLVDRQLAAGTQALVINGTTGEAPTLTKDEQYKIVNIVVTRVAHRVPVIVGTGNYSTHQTIDNTKLALDWGADACLIITPYYNKPTQEGLYAHYRAIADAVPVPIIMYNAPGRTGCDLLPETVERLATIANIVGLKECVLDANRVERLVKTCGDRLDLLAGNDDEALSAMSLGFKGVISVTSNIVPRVMRQLCDVIAEGNFTDAQRIHQQLLPLHRQLFVESNPIPCKWLLHDLGLIPSGIRLPLTTLSEQFHAQVRNAFDQLGECL